ncbi:hypothetical protein DFH08DRAFT_827867 [Mycena albidolilacea]|uniref:Uncharacterized protein n=1 Tax=Mycena albidolilacea TaxID=1033008 RepID=A0AAD6YXD4_9AGAR|nr:hypothetical protein DFH08DRAFT_827855 [Mycena albidolilacea]KAJ7301089.1 hypothetical protein DFH08DRAFT_827867 [Mycena albidolilacea]
MEKRLNRRDGHWLKEEEEECTRGKFCEVNEGGVANQGDNDGSVDNPVNKVAGLVATSHAGASCVGGVWNGSGGTGTSSWEHMQKTRVRDLKAAAAEVKQRMAFLVANLCSTFFYYLLPPPSGH